MKLTTFSNLVMGSALILAATGCHHNPSNVMHIPNGPKPIVRRDDNPTFETVQPVNPPYQDVASSTNGIPPTTGHPSSDWDKVPGILQGQTVYFDYDQSAVRATEEFKLDEVANYLKSNPTHAVLVEGNCDERGTEEYNRSLGERRSLASREQLVRLGIDPSRIDTITYGEDKPAATGHDEAAWSKNRRDDFVVLVPKNNRVALAQ